MHPLVERARRLFDDFSWRVMAVADRVALRLRLPTPVASQCLRTSQYVTVRDGTRLAIDIYRPAVDGSHLAGRFPVVWAFERYHRARRDRGRLRSRLDSDQWLRLLVRHGYVVAAADVRGSGASFGSRTGLITAHDGSDAYDITEWLAAQPWSNGRVGMFGKSFMGLMQYLAAATAPPHLVAIFPEKTFFDLYGFAYPGGVFRDDYARNWSAHVADLDRTTLADSVDDDADGAARARAVAEHANVDIHEFFAQLPFRDSRTADGRPYRDQSPNRHLAAIAASGIAVYQLAGWQDMWPRDALLWHANLPNPRRLVIGPWAHTHEPRWAFFRERLRWLDCWLKQEGNSADAHASIRYYTIGASARRAWRTTRTWPLPTEQPQPWYFNARSQDARERGFLLSTTPPEVDDGVDAYVVDYSTTSGDGTRWKNGYGRELRYRDMSANDAKALTYTSAPLVRAIEITGHPIARIWVSATANDVDVFVYLEEVRRDGFSSYITEGVLRASHRAQSHPPFHYLGLPFHGGSREQVAPLPEGTPVQLVFDLHPVSRILERGRRIRIAITGADDGNALTPRSDPPIRLFVHRNSVHPSHVVLPVIPTSDPSGD
jgi:uncharacterized protein